MNDPLKPEQFDYLLAEARRQLQLGAWRMARTWAFHARQLAGSDLTRAQQANELYAAAQRIA